MHLFCSRLPHSTIARNIIGLLLDHKVDVNAKARNGMTPLHRAALFGQKDAAELLLAYGADIDAKMNDGSTPLKVALSRGRVDVPGFLRERGAHE